MVVFLQNNNKNNDYRFQTMNSNGIRKLDLFFDEINKLAIWEPEAAKRTYTLKNECKDFVNRILEFHYTANGLIKVILCLASYVEKEKIKALGASNLLKSMTKQRECCQQQYQSLIIEKSTELERLRMQHQSLIKILMEQQEIIDHIQLY